MTGLLTSSLEETASFRRLSPPTEHLAEKSLLELKGVTKSFPGVRALNKADFSLKAGEVHALFGENGAGKSTLINIISGVLQPDVGTLSLTGEELQFKNVQEARAHGISAMFQEFSLAPDLTVSENLLLGSEPRAFGMFIRRRAAKKTAAEALLRLGFRLDPNEITGHLGRAEQQLVEMAKALLTHPRILILDEPTASLSERETETLFQTIRELKSRGTAIIYITHRVREIWEIADRITVMRDGTHVGTVKVAQTNEDQLIEMMTGRKVDDLYPPIPHSGTEIRLEMCRVTSRDGRVKDVSIEVRAGEIVGLAGLVGCGKSEIGRLCFGLGEVAEGSISVNGEGVKDINPRAMLKRGECYITSDRRGEGLLLERSTQENITLAALQKPQVSTRGVLRMMREPALARRLAEQVRLRPLNLARAAGHFSGGNQQKILVARALAVGADIVIFDEPTVGVDVAARAEIYRIMAELVRAGKSILMISSDLPEILHLCNRVYVVNHGRIVDHLQREELDEERILRGFFRETEYQ